jgi:hypothetical protein
MNCARCQTSLVEDPLIPINTYEMHIEVRFIEHMGLEGETRPVRFCRKCGLQFLQKHVELADPEQITFWA